MLSSLSLNALIAALSAGGTVLLTVYKRNNQGTPADVALTAATSIEADFVTSLDWTFPITVLTTLTPAQRTFQANDACRVDIVTTSSVGTAPVVTLTAVWDELT